MEDKQLTSQRSIPGATGTANQANTPMRITSASSQSLNQAVDGTDTTILRDLVKSLDKLAAECCKLATEKPPPSKFKRLISHPMLLLFLGSALTLGIGSWLTSYYTRKAQAIAAERSFSDELNKLRIQKVGEVWEHLDRDEVMIERLVNELTNNNGDESTQKNGLQQIRKLIETDKEMIAQHRFWLGKETYDKIQHYLDLTIFLLTRRILEPESDVESLVRDRDNARIDIESERVKFLKS